MSDTASAAGVKVSVGTDSQEMDSIDRDNPGQGTGDERGPATNSTLRELHERAATLTASAQRLQAELGPMANLTDAMEAAATVSPLITAPGLSNISDVHESDSPMVTERDTITGTPISGDGSYQKGLEKSGTKSYETYLQEQQVQHADVLTQQAAAKAAAQQLEDSQREERLRKAAASAPSERSSLTTQLTELDKILQQAVRHAKLAEDLLMEQKVLVVAGELPSTTDARVEHYQEQADRLGEQARIAHRALQKAQQLLSAQDMPAPAAAAAAASTQQVPTDKPPQSPNPPSLLENLKAQRTAARIERDQAKVALQATLQHFPEDSGDEEACAIYEGYRAPAQAKLEVAILAYETAVSAVTRLKPTAEGQTPSSAAGIDKPSERTLQIQKESEFLARLASRRAIELAAEATAAAVAEERRLKKMEEAKAAKVAERFARIEERKLQQMNRLADKADKLKASLMADGIAEAQALQTALGLATQMAPVEGDVYITVSSRDLQKFMGKRPTVPVTHPPANVPATPTGPTGGSPSGTPGVAPPASTQSAASAIEKELHELRVQRDVHAARVRVLEQERATAANRSAGAAGRVQIDELLAEARNALAPCFQTIPPYIPPLTTTTDTNPRARPYTDKPMAPQKFTDASAALCLGDKGHEVGRMVLYYYERYLRDCAARTSDPGTLRISAGAMLWEGASAIWFMDFLESCPQAPGWREGDPRSEPSFATFRENFLKQWCGKIRTDEQMALELLMSGGLQQGKNTILQYAQTFLNVRRKLPDESTVSMCKYFLLGMRTDIRVRSTIDSIGRDWASLEDLILHATAQERRITEYKLLMPRAALRAAAQMDISDGELEQPYLNAVKSDGWEPAPADQKRQRAEDKQHRVAAADGRQRYEAVEPRFSDVAAPIYKLMREDKVNPRRQGDDFIPERDLMPWKLADMPAVLPPWLRPLSDLYNSEVGRKMGLSPGTARIHKDPIVRMMCRCWWMCAYCKKRHHYMACEQKPSHGQEKRAGSYQDSQQPAKSQYGGGGRGGRGYGRGGRNGQR